MGEGAGIMIMESLENAQARGAKILCEFTGYGTTDDAHHVSAPAEDGAGAANSMRLALKSAGFNPEDIGYINAHGTSTYLNDKSETNAIKTVFGKQAYKTPVSSTKSMTGHECWMAGASEAIYSILMMRDGFVAPNVNFTGFSEGMPEINVTPKTLTSKLDIVLSNSFGFGGTNACLLFKRYAE
jgi:3-oxoacyl-[acyl-carrier-protein] synthase II